MTQIESFLFWPGVFLYAVAALLFITATIFRLPKLLKIGIGVTLAGFIMNTAAIGFRWEETGHPPLMGDFENALARSWVIVIIFLFLQLRFKSLRMLGMIILPFIILMLGYGSVRSPSLQPLSPVFKSPWLIIHILFAWFTYACYALSAALAVLFLLKTRRVGRNDLFARIPAPAVLDELSYRFVAFGFIADTIMIVAGAIWSNSLWGSYWSWDPIQTWALISWLVYGIYLHLRVIHGWKLKRAAWVSIIAVTAVLVSFWATNLLKAGLHVF